MSIIDDKKYLFDKAIEHLKNELKNIKTGRANPSLIDALMVDYYNAKTPLNQLATVSIADAHSLLVQPWDNNSIKDIEKAISASPLEFNPVNEGNQLRVPIPPLTEERRIEISKAMHQITEQAKISVRNVREEIWKAIKEQKNNGQISEDEMFKLQKELQNNVDNLNNQIQQIAQEKEKEIMTL